MHLEAHAGLGWLLGVVAPSSDRRLRAWCVAAAVLPDIDTAAYLFGDVAYGNYHHTFGHNVYLGGACVALAAWSHRGRGLGRVLLAAALVALSFASHLLADMKLSAYPVHLFWPLSRRGYEFSLNLGLAAPINTWLVYASIALAVLLAAAKGVSPLDLLSPKLDRIVLNTFRRKGLSCSTCGRACNERCDGCGASTCLRHGRVRGWFRVSCRACSG